MVIGMLLSGLTWADTPAQVTGADAGSAEPAAWPQRFPGQAQPTDPHYDLELLYAEKRFREGLTLAEERLAATPDDVVLHWMKVRFMYEIGERFTTQSNSTKIAHYKEMIAVAERGLSLDPGNPHLYFARGVAMGRLGTTRGVLSSLFMAKDLEHDWLAVANNKGWQYSSVDGGEVLPCDVYHGLGIFYRLVPDWWIVEVLAGTRGDLQESLRFNTLSTQCKPREIQNWKELAATQYCLFTKTDDPAYRQAGDQSVTRGLAIPARHEVNRLDHRHLRALRDDPDLGCGYSRDGQQDLDEKKLKSQP